MRCRLTRKLLLFKREENASLLCNMSTSLFPCRAQIASALEYQRVLSRFTMSGDTVPGARQIASVALASGLPFIGFGIVDNSIMVGLVFEKP